MALPEFFIRTIDTTVAESINLSGRALPYRPFTLDGTQELEVVWYPGFANATAQALGPHEEKTTIKGFWKDRFIQTAETETAPALYNGQNVNSVAELVQYTDSFRRLGYQLQVQWIGITRIGFLTRFTQTWHTEHDCEWEMEFTWTGREQQAIASNLPAVQNYTDFANRLTTALVDSGAYQATTTALASLNSAVATAFSVSQDVGTVVSLALGQIANATQALTNLSANVATAAQIPAGAVSQATGILSGLARSYTTVAESLERTESTVKAGLTTLALQATGGNLFAAQLVADTQYSETTNTYRGLAQQATEWAKQSQAVDSPAPDWIYVAGQDDDLRRVATLYYGDPSAWVRLAEYNGLSSSLLTPGQQVNVPPTQQPRAA
ncbi:MAG: hypothetical protein RL199_1410 [Pseudomonadota bacterium]|jgi:hypothetical protein